MLKYDGPYATGHKCHDRAVIMSLEKLPKIYLQYTGLIL